MPQILLTFPEIIAIIRRHIAKNLYRSMPGLLELFFHSYAQRDPIGFDPSTVSKWMSGAAPIRGSIATHYLSPGTSYSLADDIREQILPLMADAGAAATDLYALVLTAENISPSQRVKLAAIFSTTDDGRIAAFIAEVALCSLKLITKSTAY